MHAYQDRLLYSSAINPPYKAEKLPDRTGSGNCMQLSELQAFQVSGKLVCARSVAGNINRLLVVACDALSSDE